MTFVQAQAFSSGTFPGERISGGVSDVIGGDAFNSVLMQLMAPPTQTATPVGPAFALLRPEGSGGDAGDVVSGKLPQSMFGVGSLPNALRASNGVSSFGNAHPSVQDGSGTQVNAESIGMLIQQSGLGSIQTSSESSEPGSMPDTSSMQFVRYSTRSDLVGVPVLELPVSAIEAVFAKDLQALSDAEGVPDESQRRPNAFAIPLEVLEGMLASQGLTLESAVTVTADAATPVSNTDTDAEAITVSAGVTGPAEPLRSTAVEADSGQVVFSPESLVIGQNGQVFLPVEIQAALPEGDDAAPVSQQVLIRLPLQLAAQIPTPSAASSEGQLISAHAPHTEGEALPETMPPQNGSPATNPSQVSAASTPAASVRSDSNLTETPSPSAKTLMLFVPANTRSESAPARLAMASGTGPEAEDAATGAANRGVSLRDLINNSTTSHDGEILVESIKIDSRLSSGSAVAQRNAPAQSQAQSTSSQPASSVSGSLGNTLTGTTSTVPQATAQSVVTNNDISLSSPNANGTSTEAKDANSTTVQPETNQSTAESPSVKAEPLARIAATDARLEAVTIRPAASTSPPGETTGVLKQIVQSTVSRTSSNPAELNAPLPQQRVATAVPAQNPSEGLPASSQSPTPSSNAPTSPSGTGPVSASSEPSTVDAETHGAPDSARPKASVVITVSAPDATPVRKGAVNQSPGEATTSISPKTAANVASMSANNNPTPAQRGTSNQPHVPVSPSGEQDARPTDGNNRPASQVATPQRSAAQFRTGQASPTSSNETGKPDPVTTDAGSNPNARTQTSENARPDTASRLFTESKSPSNTEQSSTPVLVEARRPAVRVALETGASSEQTAVGRATQSDVVRADSQVRADNVPVTEAKGDRQGALPVASRQRVAAQTATNQETETTRRNAQGAEQNAETDKARENSLARRGESQEQTTNAPSTARRGFVASVPQRETSEARMDARAASRQFNYEPAHFERSLPHTQPTRSREDFNSNSGANRSFAETHSPHRESSVSVHNNESRPESYRPAEPATQTASQTVARESAPVSHESRPESLNQPTTVTTAHHTSAARETSPAARLAADPTPQLPADPDHVTQQIVRHAKLELSQGRSEMQVRLAPENLGTVRVRIAVEDGQVTAKIIADNTDTHRLLERNVQHLRVSLEHSGLNVDRIEVSQSAAGDRPSFSQHSQHSQQDRGGEAYRDTQQQQQRHHDQGGNRGGNPEQRSQQQRWRAPVSNWGHDYTA